MKTKYVYLLLISSLVLICCKCIDETDPSVFKPTDYEDFVYTAYLDFWHSLAAEEQLNITPAKWRLFIDMQLNFRENDVDVELEFVYRMLMVDELWDKYDLTRRVYEKEHPAKTYKDQIAEIVKVCWNALGLLK